MILVNWYVVALQRQFRECFESGWPYGVTLGQCVSNDIGIDLCCSGDAVQRDNFGAHGVNADCYYLCAVGQMLAIYLCKIRDRFSPYRL